MPKYLEMTADKFTFRVATDRLYTPEGVWVSARGRGKRARVGLADYLQQHNGDVAFANVKPVGHGADGGEASLRRSRRSRRWWMLHTPVSGTVVEVNAALNMGPEAINQAPI